MLEDNFILRCYHFIFDGCYTNAIYSFNYNNYLFDYNNYIYSTSFNIKPCLLLLKKEKNGGTRTWWCTKVPNSLKGEAVKQSKAQFQ